MTSLSERLRDVDTSVLERLAGIRQEESRLEAFRTRAGDMKGQVSEEVYRRVVEDYATRAATLEQQLAPLRAEARASYRKLHVLIADVTRIGARATLEKEELEFRHAVGELNDEKLAAELAAPQRRLDQCAADLAQIDTCLSRFIEAFGSKAVLEAPEPAAPPSETSAPTTAPEVSGDGEGQTILVPLAALIADAGSMPQAEYRLGAINYLGRAEDNQVQIMSPEVSRKHAVITAVGSGFELKDLGSQNGVNVNGVRTAVRNLVDGDRVEIAGIGLVFRSPWPARAPNGISSRGQR